MMISALPSAAAASFTAVDGALDGAVRGVGGEAGALGEACGCGLDGNWPSAALCASTIQPATSTRQNTPISVRQPTGVIQILIEAQDEYIASSRLPLRS